jgi:hypothetical protein
MLRWLRRRGAPTDAEVEPGAVEQAARQAEAGLEQDKRTVDRHRPIAQSLARAAAENHFSDRVRSILRGEDGTARRA